MYDAQPTSLSLDTSLPLSEPEVYNLDDINLDQYSLDSSVGISPLMCDSQQFSSSYNSLELNSTYGIGGENGESSMMANNVIQNYDRLTLASEASPPFYASNFQTTIMIGRERQQFSLLSLAKSYDSNLMSPQINWSPVKAVKARPIQEKGRRRQIPRNRNGIRKKNAKYEIPPGETLENIDELIAQARAISDIENVVRLIRNKRLLRNRLAALESRERKKRYMEKLEKDNKQLNEDLDIATEELAKAVEKANDLERRIASLKKMVDHVR